MIKAEATHGAGCVGFVASLVLSQTHILLTVPVMFCSYRSSPPLSEQWSAVEASHSFFCGHRVRKLVLVFVVYVDSQIPAP
jgi:hypothetical protein